MKGDWELFLAALCRAFDITEAEFSGRTRRRYVVMAREIAVHHLRREGVYVTEIGRRIGRCHADVCHLTRMYDWDAQWDATMRAFIQDVERFYEQEKERELSED